MYIYYDKKPEDLLHDLNSAYFDFKIFLQLLESGYSYQEGETSLIFSQLKKSLQSLKNSIQVLEDHVK